MNVITNVEKEMREKVSLGYDLMKREYDQLFSSHPIAWVTSDNDTKAGFSCLSDLVALYIEDLLDEVDDEDSLNTESVHNFDKFIVKGILAAFEGSISEDTEVNDIMLMEDKEFSDLSKVTLISHLETIAISNAESSKVFYDLSKEYFKDHNLTDLIIFKKRFLRHLSISGFSKLNELYKKEGTKALIAMVEEETPFLLSHSQIVSDNDCWVDMDLPEGQVSYSLFGVSLKSEHEFNHVTWVIRELLLGFEDHKIYPSPALIEIIASAYRDYFCSTNDVTLDVYEESLMMEFRERQFVFMDDFDVFVEPTLNLQVLILEQFGSQALKQVKLESGVVLPTVFIPDEDGDDYREFSFKEEDRHFIVYLDSDLEEFIIVPKDSPEEFSYDQFLRNLMPFV